MTIKNLRMLDGFPCRIAIFVIEYLLQHKVKEISDVTSDESDFPTMRRFYINTDKGYVNIHAAIDWSCSNIEWKKFD